MYAAAEPNCSSTLSATGAVLDEAYHTNDCQWEYKGGLIPDMRWTGPGVYDQLTVSTPTTVWSGMQFNVQYAMDTLFHQCNTYFTNYFHPVPQDTADNIPTFTHMHRAPQMFVYCKSIGLALLQLLHHVFTLLITCYIALS